MTPELARNFVDLVTCVAESTQSFVLLQEIGTETVNLL
jgi:hypothetical protein